MFLTIKQVFKENFIKFEIEKIQDLHTKNTNL